MDLPPLSESERAGLVESIRQDGVKYPVLLDSAGEVIDGHNRQAICAELGIDCPTVTLDVDAVTADRLRISLNVDRRQLPPDYRRHLVVELRGLDMTQQEIADTIGVSQRTVSNDLQLSNVAKLPVAITGRDGKKRPASRANSTARRNEIAARKKADADRTAERRRSERATRAANTERLTAAMGNAPAGALNLPALREVRTARTALIKIATTIPPERFITQIPIEACREITSDIVDWWLKAAQLATDRRALEGADLPPLPASQRLPGQP